MDMDWTSIIEGLVAPLMAAELFAMVLAYFLIVHRRLSADIKGYVCFLVVFIVFLITQPVQRFGPRSAYMVLARVSLLFAAGQPALLIAAAKQCGIRWNRWLTACIFSSGTFFAALYCAMLAIFWHWWPLCEDSSVFERLAHGVQLIATLVMLVLPMSYLMVREYRGGRDAKLLAMLFGVFLFGVSVLFSTMHPAVIGYLYFGSVLSALCWAWAVFRDVHDMKGRVAALKDELQASVRGPQCPGADMERLLEDLEHLSQGNLGVYKMRLREVLSRLTDATIEAGGDVETLMARNEARVRDVDGGENPQALREMVKTEAEQLSQIITALPKPQKNRIVTGAEAFIQTNYDRDFSVGEMAEELRISQAYLMREFKKGTGQTISKYLTALRIEKAKELLATMSVTEVAFKVGYNDSNYFSSVFKKHTGQTAGQFKDAVS